MPIETERGLRVTVSFGQRRVLFMLSQRGRRVSLSTEGWSPEVRAGMDGLVAMLLMRSTPLVGSNRVELELTDLGAQVVDQMTAVDKNDALQDPNFQTMMGMGTAKCPTCNTEQQVANSRFVGHIRESKVTTDGFSQFKFGRCPGSGTVAP